MKWLGTHTISVSLRSPALAADPVLQVMDALHRQGNHVWKL